jgi:hypothetical protein
LLAPPADPADGCVGRHGNPVNDDPLAHRETVDESTGWNLASVEVRNAALTRHGVDCVDLIHGAGLIYGRLEPFGGHG